MSLSTPFLQDAYPEIHRYAVEKVAASGALGHLKTAVGAPGLLKGQGLLGRLAGMYNPGRSTRHFEQQVPGILEEGIGRAGKKYEDIIAALAHEKDTGMAALSKQLTEAQAAAHAGGKGGAPGHRWPLPLAIGAGAIGVPTSYYLGQNSGEDEARRAKMLAFGGGAAAGLFAPRVIRGLTQTASNMGLYPGQGY